MKNHLLVILILFAVPILVSPVSAQSPDSTAARAAFTDASPENLGLQAAHLLARIRLISNGYRTYQDRLLNASHEDSLVLNLQIEMRIDEFVVSLPRLANFYPRDPQTPGERELRERIEAIYRVVMPDIWRLIRDGRADIDRLRAQRVATAPGQQLALEYRVARQLGRLDLLTAFAGEQLHVLGEIGLADSTDQAIYRDLLNERADDLLGRLRLGTERITKYNQQLKDKPTDADLGLVIAATRHILKANTKSLEKIVHLMEREGLDTDAYRTYLITITRDIISGMLDAHATITLLRRLWLQSLAWVISHGPTYTAKLLLFVAIMFVGQLLAKLAHKAIDASLKRSRVNLSQLLHRTLVSSTHNLVLALALTIGLSELGLNLGPLLAGFGVVGFILGFAMQDSLSNFASGLMILFYRPYDVGDLVDIGGVFGKVEHMSLVSTSILTLDNQKLVVPNSKIWGDVIKNVTDQHVRRVDMVFGIGYSDDIPKAEEVLNAILAEHDKVLAHPEPMVKLHTLNDSSVDFVVRPWVKTEDYWDVYWDVTRTVKMRFDQEQISIPFPQQDVHIYNDDQGGRTETDSGK